MKVRKKLITKNFIKHNATMNFTLSIFLIVFFIVLVTNGCMLVYISIKYNHALSIPIGLFLIAMPIVSIFKKINETNSFKHGEYVIVEDTLKEFETSVETSIKGNDQIMYYLVFKDIYDLYRDKIVTDVVNYRKAKVDDKYYIVLNNYQSMIFNKNEYRLSENLKVIDIEELPRYLDFKKVEKTFGEKKEINKEALKDCISNSYFLMKVNFCVLVVFILTNIFVTLFYGENSDLHFIIPILSLLLIVFSSRDALKFSRKLNAIRDGNIIIKTDIIKSIDERVTRSERNRKILKLRFKSYKRAFNVEKDNYNNLKADEKVYLVFFPGANVPFVMYQAKYSNISPEFKQS